MLFIQIMSWVPLRIGYIFSDLLYGMVYYVIGYRKALVRKNLERAFPEKSTRERRQIERTFYRNLCDYAVETLKIISFSRREINDRVSIQGLEEVQKTINKNQSLIILASHQFNWEWALAKISVAFGIPVDFIYQKLSSSFFDRFLIRCRTRFGAYPIEREQTARVSVLRKGIQRAIASVSDQYPGHEKDKKVWVQFLHQRTAFFLGVSHLATLLKYPVFCITIYKVKRGYYEFRIKQISEPPYHRNEGQEIVTRYIRELENSIREAPTNWLWTHNRWKKR